MIKKLYIIIIITILSFTHCSKILIDEDVTNQNIEDFEIAWNTINDLYPLLEYKKINWDSIYTIYKPKAELAEGDDIYNIVFDLLRELKDPHVYFQSKGGGFITPYTGKRWLRDYDAYNPVIIRKYFDEELQLTCLNNVESGITNNKIGYIYISGFTGDQQMAEFDQVMLNFKNTNSLIIDVRRNTGGWSENVQEVVGWFIDTTITYQAFFKDEEPYEGNDYVFLPKNTDFRYTKPVVVLLNGATISAGEIFTDIMKQLPNVTLIGDTTAGAGCNDSDHEGDFILNCGIKIHIGTGYILRLDGIPFEWNGVEPDIYLPQSKNDLDKGQDLQFEKAIFYLKTINKK